ncbi:hypothetical protein MTO96_044390, partial [Rhipicephalus appendiculatus]
AEAATLSSELIAACSLERSGHQFVAAGNVSRRSQREKRRDAGLELQGKTGLFPLRASDAELPLDEGREGGTPAFFYKKEEKGGPPSEQTQHAAGANSPEPAPATLFPEHGGGGAGAARRRAVDGRLQTG